MRKLLFILFLICPFFLNAQVLNEDDLGYTTKKGKTIRSLFKQLKVSSDFFQELGKLVKNFTNENNTPIKIKSWTQCIWCYNSSNLFLKPILF